MPLSTPARSEILARVRTDYRVETSVDPLRRSKEYGLLRALTGQSAALYGLARYYFRQLFPDSAEAQYFWRWLGIFGLSQKPAQAWVGTFQFTGTAGTNIPTGTVVARSDGIQYQTTATGVIAANGVTTVAAAAKVAGAASDLDVGQQLTLGSSIAGIATAVSVISVTATGEDAETATAALIRLLQRLRNPPRGGGPGDYVSWALEVPGATRAWEYPRQFGPNTVGVSFVRDGDGLGALALPDATERAEMQSYLNAHVPVTVDAHVNTLVAVPVDVSIGDLTPDTPDIRAAIILQLKDQFSQDAVPGGTIFNSRIDAAISGAEGEQSHTLLEPQFDTSVGVNEFPILGDVVFQGGEG